MTFKTNFVTTPMEGRFAWCYLDQPRTVDMNGKTLESPKFECAFYFAKHGPNREADSGYGFFAKLAWEVVANAFRGQWPMIAPNGEWKEWPIDDCDVPNIVDKQPWARGMWRVGLSGGKFKPGVFDLANQPILPGTDGFFRPGQFKGGGGIGGDWGLASVNAYEWSFGTTRKGVSFGLEGIKVTRQDEQVGGATRSADQMFGAPTGQPMAPPVGQPPVGGYAPSPQQQYAPPPQAGYAPYPTQGAAPQPQYAPTPVAPVPYSNPGAQPGSATAPMAPAAGFAQPYPSNAPPQPYAAPAPHPGGMPPVPPQFGQR